MPLQRTDKPTVYSLRDIAKEYGGEIERRAKQITEAYGIPTPWPALNSLLRGGGFLHGLLYVVAGRPGMAKTTFMQSLAVHIARQGKPVMVFSLELTRLRLLERLAYQESGIDAMRHAREKQPLNEAQLGQFRQAIADLATLPVYVKDTTGMSPGMIVQTMNAYAREYGIEAMFIDYLHIMRTDGTIFGGGREREIGTMVEQVRDAAKSLNVACILLSQLNREVEKERPFVPNLSHLRDSGTIEQVAYSVMALYRQDYYVLNGMLNKTDQDGDPEVIPLNHKLSVLILKQQDGPTGIAELHFDDGTGRIT